MTQPAHKPPQVRLESLTYNRRRGFTLMEVMLVLALIVVISGLAWPMLARSFADGRLNQGADNMRTLWTKARLHAMTTGLPQVFRYQPETAKFKLEAWTALDSDLEAYSPLGVQEAAASSARLVELPVGASAPPGHGELPEGVVFQSSLTEVDTRNQFITPLDGLENRYEIWSEPIVFFPDGTCSNCRLMLRNQSPLFVLVELRGLTGVVTVSGLLSESEVPQ